MNDETIRVCAYCAEEIEIKKTREDSFNWCDSCQLLEGKTEEVTVEEYERRRR